VGGGGGGGGGGGKILRGKKGEAFAPYSFRNNDFLSPTGTLSIMMTRRETKRAKKMRDPGKELKTI